MPEIAEQAIINTGKRVIPWREQQRKSRLLQFVSEGVGAEHPEDNGAKRLTDQEATERLRAVCRCEAVKDIGGWTGEKLIRAEKKT